MRNDIPDTVYIGEEAGITRGLLLSCGNTVIRTLDYGQLIQTVTKQHSIGLKKMFPLSYKNDTFSVSLIHYSVQRVKKHTLHYTQYSSYVVYFIFDGKGFRFVKIKEYSF
ncbi:hypothetical protein ACTHGU_03790 [Chitinophagaceae bacterium MMS25-I14]